MSGTMLRTEYEIMRGKKGIQTGEEKAKLSLFANDMTLYRENSKKHTKKQACRKQDQYTKAN